MGGVCSGGTKHINTKSIQKVSKFFEKQKLAKGSEQIENNRDSNANAHAVVKRRQGYTFCELPIPFSRELLPSTPAKMATKVYQKNSFLGRAGIIGLERTIDVLDTLGSSMSTLNSRSGFVSGISSRGSKISILAFEVANTISKGAKLFQSLAEKNIQVLKKEILHSEGVQQLVSTNMKELLSIAAADKREELDVFLQEVIRFGNLCKDPQWHNLDRYFSSLDSENINHKQLKVEAQLRMQELTTLAQNTSELYHELHALDRFEQDYQQKLQEVDSLNLPRRGETLMILHSELKQQKKLVKSLQKKSLWSRKLEEIMEKLVDSATYMHQAILEAFQNSGKTMVINEPRTIHQSLGAAGLALHYANIINQIDNIASRPTHLPPNTRDTLYQGLPNSVKTTLRSRLQIVDVKEELSAFQVKGEMEKVLHWLVPVATNTTKMHQGFGWVGEWANTGHEFGKSATTNNNPIRLQTLYHADKQKTEKFILELLILLHRLINMLRHRDHGFQPQPTSSPINKETALLSNMQRTGSLNNGAKIQWIQISQEERNLLDKVNGRRIIPGISKSQEFVTANKKSQVFALSKSMGNSPNNREFGVRHSLDLDVVDGLNSRL
ncbi:protein PSK SIMULATOR 2 [Mangifera indica]|uniref:protein PSK SIMULATOR 2 n=1 Tax=Mangifera indica TaxID=29780 RepID=UPI001CFA823E|nr:protein PSK SIMULATOR 2 [Mangifera indica]